jgi:hypothetical protein
MASALAQLFGIQPSLSDGADALELAGVLDPDALPQRGVHVDPGPLQDDGRDAGRPVAAAMSAV